MTDYNYGQCDEIHILYLFFKYHTAYNQDFKDETSKNTFKYPKKKNSLKKKNHLQKYQKISFQIQFHIVKFKTYENVYSNQ